MTTTIDDKKLRLLEIDAEFRPTVDSYLKMAREVLGLQEDVLAETLEEAFPGVTRNLDFIATLDARAALDKTENAVVALSQNQDVKIALILHDKVQSKFYLFAEPEVKA